MSADSVVYCWYAELAVQTLLFALLWYRAAPRWFSITIGTDTIAQLSQAILYVSKYREFARIVGRSGYIAISMCCVLALIEAADLESGRLRWWHVRILAFWISGQLLCGWMEVGQPNSVIGWWNGVLLTIQGVAFAGWIVLFGGSTNLTE